MTQTAAEQGPLTADRLVGQAVAGALALQAADIYGRMDVRRLEPLPPFDYCGHTFIPVTDPQPSGAFKYRGASAAAVEAESAGHTSLETFSTGSHGVALGMAGAKVSLKTFVHVPDDITPYKEKRLRATGSEVVKGGKFGDAKARAQKGENGLVIHPFANGDVRKGQSLFGIELAEIMERMGLDGNEGEIVIPVAVAGGSHIIGIAGPIVTAQRAGRLGPNIKVLPLRSRTNTVDAIAIKPEDRDPDNQLVLEDGRYMADGFELSDYHIGRGLASLREHGVDKAEAAGAMPLGYALAYARKYPYLKGSGSKKITFILPVSGLNGSPEANAPFLNAAPPTKTAHAAGGLMLKSTTRQSEVNSPQSWGGGTRISSGR